MFFIVKSIKKISLFLFFIVLLPGIQLFAECNYHDIIDFNSLELVTKKSSGMNKGGVYKDSTENIWFVKDYTNASQSNADEFLGGKLMKLFLDDHIAKVKLVKAEGSLVASELLKGFAPSIKADLDGKKVIGEEKLVVLMDWLGLEDRHGGNQGFLISQDQAIASRVDYDSVFQFDNKDSSRIVIKLSQMHKPNFHEIKQMIECIINTDENLIIDAFSSSLCQLEAVNAKVNIEKQMQQCDILLKRRDNLKTTLLAIDWIIAGFQALENQDDTTLFEHCLNESSNQKLVQHAFGKNFINIVCANGERKHISYLKEKMNINVDTKDELGRTPLFDLVRHGRYHEAKILIDFGANVNALDNNNRTPIFEAAEFSDVMMVSRLKDWGATLDALNSKGKTPLFYAAEYGKTAVVAYLLGLKEVNINAQDVKGKTVLFDPARNGRKDIVELLVKNEINVNLTDNDGNTAKSYAAKLGREDIVKILDNAGDFESCQVNKSKSQKSQWIFWNLWPG